jgi:hypothetical protein
VTEKEMEERYGGHTWMWRNCCLEKVKEAFQMKECKGSKIVATNYNWCMTRDICNLTITGRKRSMIRRGGLLHSQFYAMHKLQFDAMKHFPWDDGDDTMAMMALDKIYREALRATMGAKAMNMKECRQSFNRSGRRYMLGSRMNDDRSWGGREEHRMSLPLMFAVGSELRRRGDPELRPEKSRFQFYVHPTKIVNQFSEAVTLPIASWYQETLGMAPEGMLGIDHQKLAILQCFLLKNAYGNSLLSRYPILWKKGIQQEGGEEIKIGLGLKDVVEKYGFGWLPNDMFNWKANSFAIGVADRFPFPIRQLEKQFQSRKRKRSTMINILQEVDQVTGRIKVLTEEYGEVRLYLLRWLATRVMRQYHSDVYEALYESPFEFKGKESERERQRRERANSDSEVDSEEEEPRPRKKARVTKKNAKVVKKTWDEPPSLTYASVKAELEEEPLPVGIGKLYFNRKDFFQLIFQPNRDEELGQGWKSKPYLHALEMIKGHLDKDDVRFLMRRLERLFNTTCHCVPNISRDRWLVNSGKSKVKPGWLAFDEKGDRIDCSSTKGYLALEEGSSWRENRSIYEDEYWGITLEEAISRE